MTFEDVKAFADAAELLAHAWFEAPNCVKDFLWHAKSRCDAKGREAFEAAMRAS